MSGIATKKNVGHLVAGRAAAAAIAPALITAGGSGDNVLVVGDVIDTLGFESAVLTGTGRAALLDTESLDIAVQIEESGDGSSFDAPEVLQASTVLILADSTTNFEAVLKLDLNELGNRKRFVRIGVTPNLSRGATDTAIVLSSLLLGGAERLPAV